MCGIAGIWRVGGRDESEALARMTGQLVHRGPDAGGAWSDPERGVWLGHRRLSILDLSDAGRQPMTSASGRFVITYNGEVYNHEELRQRLDAESPTSWRGHSDTETLLVAFEHWGLEKTLERSIGMFAFALWDRERGELHLARDRVGKKPLYYGWSNGVLLFGSELKALRAHPDFNADIDTEALGLYLRFGFIPSPWCIHGGFRKLLPGSFLTLRNARDTEAQTRRYWDPSEVLARARRAPFQGDDREAIDELERSLRDAVRLRMIADVPLGALLSGGVDSSLVVALMQAQSSQRVRTFSIGFREAAYDEAVDARRVAAHLGTEHTDLYVTGQDALDVIPLLPGLYDEPFADSSQIPTYLVSRLAREHVTVALTGDGGDEVWGGYDRHVWGRRIWRSMARLPRRPRAFLASSLAAVSPQEWDRWFARADGLLPAAMRTRMPGHKIHKLVHLARATTMEDFYLALASLAWKRPDDLLAAGREPAFKPMVAPAGLDIAELIMLGDLTLGFPDDMLTKVDRASMGVSLEARVPFSDHRLIELACSMPLSMKIREGRGKWLPRQVLHRYVPRELIDRPKMGFGIPVDRWLRGPLRDWAEDLLKPDRIEEGGLLRAQPIRRAFEEHLEGRGSRHVELWTVLMFQAWRDALKETPSRVDVAA